MEEQRRLSLRLYEVLENVGASEKVRKLHKRLCRTQEILHTVRMTLQTDSLRHIYWCGSTYEGSVTPDLRSDMDVITCYTPPPIVLDQHTAPRGVSLLMVTDAWTYIGYVKLQVMDDCLPLTSNDVIPNRGDDIDEVGRICRRHFTTENMHGPAQKSVNDRGVHVLDLVPAYKCNTLPLFASNRLDTLKKRTLISDGEFDKLKQMGCMFVSAGYFMSLEKDIEWRLSLSLQERYLMSKVNPTQHKVYILLKMIKKNIIEKVLRCTVLTSYHCKTCVLYAVEMTQARSWLPENTINCLKLCIKLMSLWLKRNYCPNYFISDQNLFSKEGFSKFRKPLLQMMELLQSNNHFLTLIQSDHLGQILLEGEWRWTHVINMEKADQRFSMHATAINSIVQDFPHVMYKLCGGQYNPTSLVSALNSLQQTDTITEHTAAETQAARGYLYPWFHLHIAKSLACLSYRYYDRSYSKQILKAVDYHFRKAEFTDRVNVKLAQVSVLYTCEQYEMCDWLLCEIDNDYTHMVIRLCPCVDLYYYLYHEEQNMRDMHRTASGMSVRKMLKSFFACCVVFLPSQYQIVPIPLQYEMFRSVGTQQGSRDKDIEFWFDWCVIDARVYLYLMQYLVSKELQKDVHKQVAMHNIRVVIEEDNELVLRQYKYRQLGHRETAYNILGWIYMQEQRYGDATKCFLKSWKIRPFHNAAKFHMRDLLARL